MKRTTLLVAGLVGLLLALGFIMPAVAWLRQHGFDGRAVLMPLILGGALLSGAVLALRKGARHFQA